MPSPVALHVPKQQVALLPVALHAAPSGTQLRHAPAYAGNPGPGLDRSHFRRYVLGPAPQQPESELQPAPSMLQEGMDAAHLFAPLESNSQRPVQQSESLEHPVPAVKHAVHLLSVGEQYEPLQQSDDAPHAVALSDEMQPLHEYVPLDSAQMGQDAPHSAEMEHSLLQAYEAVHLLPMHLPKQQSESDPHAVALPGGAQQVPLVPETMLHESPVAQQLGAAPVDVHAEPSESVQLAEWERLARESSMRAAKSGKAADGICLRCGVLTVDSAPGADFALAALATRIGIAAAGFCEVKPTLAALAARIGSADTGFSSAMLSAQVVVAFEPEILAPGDIARLREVRERAVQKVVRAVEQEAAAGLAGNRPCRRVC